MTDEEKLAALGRILYSMGYVDIGHPREADDGRLTQWVVIDGAEHVNADDAAVLLEVLNGARLGSKEPIE